MTTIKKIHLLALATIFALVARPVAAQELPKNLFGSVTVGGQTGSGLNDSSKLQQYETVPNGVALFGANFNWRTDSRYFINFDSNKLGLDDQFAQFQTGRKQSWTVNLQLSQNPRWFSNTAETLYNQVSPGAFVLADGMRSTLQRVWSPLTGTDPAAPANSNDPRFWSVRDYMSGAQAIDLSYLRRTSSLDFNLDQFENWSFKASYQRETRNGSQPVAFTAGPGIDEVANPVDYTTQDTRAEVEYTGKRFYATGAFLHSVFSNAVPYTTIDNPVRLNNTDYFWSPTSIANNTAANATARLWNVPDNKATSFDFSTGAPLPMHHKVTLTVTTIGMTMDRPLLPQATNPLLNLATNNSNYGLFTLVPEYSSISGDMRQTSYLVKFIGDPHAKFGYSVSYKSFDLKDRKPTYTFHSTVNSDGGASYSATGITTGNASFDYGTAKVEAHVTPIRGLRFGLNVGHTKTNYEERDVLDITDNTIGFTVDATKAWANFHGGYTKLSRDRGAVNPTSPAEGTTGGPLDVNAQMKDVARQDGKSYSAALTLTPLDKAAFTFSLQGNDSDFPTTSIGLKKSTVRNYGFDLTYAITPQVSANAGYIYETYHIDTNLWYGANGTVAQPAATNTLDQYFNAIADKVNTYNAGLRLDIVPHKFDVDTNYSYSKGTSDSGFTIVPGGALGGDLFFPTNTTTVNFPATQYLNYPQVFSATTIWKTFLNYHLNQNVTISFLYWHQKFDQANWATDPLAYYMMNGSALYASTPGAIATVYPNLDPSANRALFLGATVPNYNANIARVSLGYRF